MGGRTFDLGMKTPQPRLRTLKNGMRVAWIEQPASTAAAIEVFVNVGSRHEPSNINGASHFIEHMMFKGTKKRPNPQAVSRDLDRFGADYNAATGKDRTSYYVKIEADRLHQAIDVLHDMLAHATFKADEMERERGVIIEEINMYEDNPQSQMSNLLDEMTFGEHPLAWNIAGTRDIIRRVTRNDLLAYRETFYRPDHMVVAVAGRLPKGTWELLEKTFGAWPKHTKEKPPTPPTFIASEVNGVRLSLQHKKIEQAQLGMAFLTYPQLDPRQEALRLLAVILGGTMSSRLFTEVREKRGLCYNISAGRTTFTDTGTFYIAAGLEKGRLQEAVEVIWQELEKMTQKPVSAQELARAKDFLRGKFFLDFEDPLARADWYGDQLCYRERWRTPEERLKAIEGVTPAQLRAVAKEVFRRDHYAVSVVGPFEDQEKLRPWFAGKKK